MTNTKSRNHAIDFLKGIAILAVVLYHLGISKFGYLGVDIFFVISGYLVSLGLVKNFSQDRFSFLGFLNSRLSRLWPGLILISAVALTLGWYFMMPIHFKLNCESVVGTITFTNNFVQYITTGDYWTSANEFKPLMHTWYIGVLMQFYIIFPIIFIIAKRFAKQWLNATFYALTVLCFLSIALYLSPIMSESQDFYMLPTRFFELGFGGMLALVIRGNDNSKSLRTFLFCIFTLLAFVFIFGPSVSAIKLRLTIITAISLVLIGLSNLFAFNTVVRKALLPISFLGVASYSIYLSHQVFFAFYRYIVNNIFTPFTYLCVLLGSLIIGILLYFAFEKPLSQFVSKGVKRMYLLNTICLGLAVILVVASLRYYKQDGLVRNIPELGLYVGENNMTPEEYNQAPHSLNLDFEDNGKKNILVIGDSFGRDWVNILLEASVDSIFNISYQMYADSNTNNRIAKADYVFVATNLPFFESYNYKEIFPALFSRKFYRVGLKSFSDCFIGNIYSRRRSEDYFQSSGIESDYVKNINLYEKEMFKDNFIDMMSLIRNADGSIRLFTDNNMYLTQDGIHFTKAGAKYYAERLDVWQYLK